MLESEATYKDSNKRGRAILVDGENFEYRYNKENKNTVYYLCRKRIAYACTATAFVKKVFFILINLENILKYK